MSGYERQLVVSRWQSYGDRKKLGEFLASHPSLEPDTWRTRAELLADEGKLAAAFKLVQQFVRTPGNSYSDQSLSMAQMETDFQIHPSDAKRGLFLYSAQKDRSQWDAALATLEKVAALPDRPKHVYFEMATVYAQKGDFAKAWQLAQQYLNLPE
jgi:tetratricopeptide (TPR) repeat protein